MMDHPVLARKWRPRNFQEMVGQDSVQRMLINSLELKRLHHALLFTGTRGVGKTTLARIFAKCLNCDTGITANPCGTCKICESIDAGRFLDLIEVDAASRTKVEDTRELLENIQYLPAQGRFKIYLIDEVHMLSGHSFNALLKTLEEPPPYVKFLLATTDPKRLPITILSRCLQFNLKKVAPEKIEQHLQHICTKEGITFEPTALSSLAEAADGSLRDALSLLDQSIALCGTHLLSNEIRDMLGCVEEDSIFRLLTALADQDGKALLTHIAGMDQYAPDFNQLLDKMLSILHQINVIQIVPDSSASQKLAAFKTLFSPEDIQLYYQIALIGRRDLPFVPSLRQGFEMILLRMLAFRLETPTQEIKEKKPAHVEKIAQDKKPVITNHWSDLLPKLALTGMAYALASNCTLEKITDDKIELLLTVNHAALLTKNSIERIEQALNRHFNKPIKLDIKTATTSIETPAKHQQEEQVARRVNAETAIKNDAKVKQMMDVFGATVDENSIQAI